MSIHIYTSEEISNMECEVVSSLGESVIYYKLTKGEYEWLKFISGKYSIADYLWRVMTTETEDSGFVVCLEMMEVSQALNEDCEGFGKAVMLSDDSSLQKIFFCNFIEN